MKCMSVKALLIASRKCGDNRRGIVTGTYALSKKNERLSDLVAKAGGVTSDAYVRGARLIRKMSEEELRRKEDATRMAIKVGADSTTLYVYTVGIHLDEALKIRVLIMIWCCARGMYCLFLNM